MPRAIHPAVPCFLIFLACASTRAEPPATDSPVAENKTTEKGPRPESLEAALRSKTRPRYPVHMEVEKALLALVDLCYHDQERAALLLVYRGGDDKRAGRDSLRWGVAAEREETKRRCAYIRGITKPDSRFTDFKADQLADGSFEYRMRAAPAAYDEEIAGDQTTFVIVRLGTGFGLLRTDPEPTPLPSGCA